MEWEKQKKAAASHYKYAEIIWNDAAALDSGWLSPEEFDQKVKDEPQLVLTRGWVIRETSEHIFYCCDVGPKGETNGRGQIPKKMILEIRYTDVKQPKKRKPIDEKDLPASEVSD